MLSPVLKTNIVIQGRLDHLETQPGLQHFDIGGGPLHGGVCGYQIRVPNPKSWNLTIFKNGEHGFLPWQSRSVDLQVRAIWGKPDRVSEAIHEEIEPVDQIMYTRMLMAPRA